MAVTLLLFMQKKGFISRNLVFYMIISAYIFGNENDFNMNFYHLKEVKS